MSFWAVDSDTGAAVQLDQAVITLSDLVSPHFEPARAKLESAAVRGGGNSKAGKVITTWSIVQQSTTAQESRALRPSTSN